MVDIYGTPHGPALHMVERYRLLDYETAKEAEERGESEKFRLRRSDPGVAPEPDYKGKGLHLEFTVEDHTLVGGRNLTYQRPLSPLGQWPESVCAENRHEYYAEKMLRCRLRTSRISEPHTPPFAEGLSALGAYNYEQARS